MKTSALSHQSCLSSIKLLGDFWTLRIIDTLDNSELRFCELQRSLGNVNPVTLTDRLKKLEYSGVVERTEESVDGCSVTYALTPAGREALPVIQAIDNFAQKAQLT